MLYVGRPGLAVAYFAASVLAFLAERFVNPYFVLATLGLAATCSAHAFRLARDYNDARARRWYSQWYGMAGISISFVALALGVRAFWFEPFRAPSASMAPTIETGAHMIVQKWGYGNHGFLGISLMRSGISTEVRRGDIMAFEYPVDQAFTFVKRVVGLPGDRISYLNKRLRINGREMPSTLVGEYRSTRRSVRADQFTERIDSVEYNTLREPDAPPDAPFLRAFPFWERCSNSPEGISCTVPKAHYFVLGDNRDNSNDSRLWGFVPAANLIGKVRYVFQPPID